MGKTRSLVTAAFLAAVLVASKFALDGLPNIELVSLLVILYTLEYPRLAVPAVYTYVFVYGLLNGFGIWWFPQLYIWAVLMLFARLMRQNRSVLLWALLSGLFGLCYGALFLRGDERRHCRGRCLVGNRHPIRPAARRGQFCCGAAAL